MEEQPQNPRPAVPTWIWILGVLGLILTLQFGFSALQRSEQIKLHEAMTLIKEGQVKEIQIAGNQMRLTLNSDEVRETQKISGEIYTELYEFHEVTPQDLATINIQEIDVQEVRQANMDWFSILIGMGPIIYISALFTIILFLFTYFFRKNIDDTRQV